MKNRLKTPIFIEDIKKLKVGDVIYITGELLTARDLAHRRALEYYNKRKKLPLEMKNKPIFHCGPLIKKEKGKYIIVSAGPTTSMRMEMFEDKFIEKFEVRVIIGKGGMGARTTAAMMKFGAIYCAFTGGAGVLAKKAIKRVKSVDWLNLGIPEAIWTLEVEDFGPLVVAIDAYGNNLYEEVAKNVEKNKKMIYHMISSNHKVL